MTSQYLCFLFCGFLLFFFFLSIVLCGNVTKASNNIRVRSKKGWNLCFEWTNPLGKAVPLSVECDKHKSCPIIFKLFLRGLRSFFLFFYWFPRRVRETNPPPFPPNTSSLFLKHSLNKHVRVSATSGPLSLTEELGDAALNYLSPLASDPRRCLVLRFVRSSLH